LSPTQAELTIGSFSQTSYVYSTLPSGAASRNYQVTINNYAMETLSAISSTTASTSPVVTLSAKTDVESFLSTNLASSFSSGNVDGAVQAVNNIATTVNIVNCTAASASFCSSLNRAQCSTVPNICGSCLDGFNGIVGNANTKCFNATQSATSNGPVSGSVGSSCSTDGDCLYGFCKNFICLEPNKTCPSSGGTACSGSGQCVFYDSSNNLLPECLQTNVFCEAKCLCKPGFAASDCSLNTEAASKRDTIRAQLCSAINSVYLTQGDSAATLKTLAGSLDSSFSTDEVNTQAAVQNCILALSTVTDLVSKGFLKSLSSTTLATLTSTLSSFIAKASTITSADTTSSVSSIDTSFASDSLSQLSNGVLQTIVNGEDAVKLISSNFQASIQRSRISEISSLSPPQTTAEIVYGSLGPKILITDAGANALNFESGYAKLSITKYSKNPNKNSAEVTTPILKVETFSKTTSSKGTSSSLTTTNVPSSSPVSSSVSVSSSLSSFAKTSATNSYLNFTTYFYIVHQFSSIQNFNFSEDIFAPGFVSKTNLTLPACSVYDSTLQENIACSGCNISSYTDFNVTFSCNNIKLLRDLSSSSSSTSSDGPIIDGDDLTDDGASSSLPSGSQFGAILSLLAAEFISVLSFNPFDLNLAQSQGILSFVGCLVFVIIFGIIFFLDWDRKDNTDFHEFNALKLKDSVDMVGKERYDFDLKALFIDHNETNILRRITGLFKKSANKIITTLKYDNTDVKNLKSHGVYSSKTVNSALSSQAEMQGAVFEFLEQAAPQELLKQSHPLKRILNCIMLLHDFSSMFFRPSLQHTRTMRYLTLVRTVLVGLFCDTLFFGIFFPDDGTCSTYVDRKSCVTGINKATNQPTCMWNENPDTSGTCSLRPAPTDFIFTIMIALLTVLIGVPLDLGLLIIQYNYCRLHPRLHEIG